jgi:hypothetical protein
MAQWSGKKVSKYADKKASEPLLHEEGLTMFGQ